MQRTCAMAVCVCVRVCVCVCVAFVCNAREGTCVVFEEERGASSTTKCKQRRHDDESGARVLQPPGRSGAARGKGSAAAERPPSDTGGVSAQEEGEGEARATCDLDEENIMTPFSSPSACGSLPPARRPSLRVIGCVQASFLSSHGEAQRA